MLFQLFGESYPLRNENNRSSVMKMEINKHAPRGYTKMPNCSYPKLGDRLFGLGLPHLNRLRKKVQIFIGDVIKVEGNIVIEG